MRPKRSPVVVVLGMMSKMPVGGVVWQTLHYLLGLRLLGYDPYYVEAHARTPGMLMEEGGGDGSAAAADFIGSILGRFDMADRWAFQALHADGRCYGLSEGEVAELYRSADLLINLHGGTEPLPEHAETGRLVYVETDPVQLQAELAEGKKETIDFLSPHCAFFTFAENLTNADCALPRSTLFPFHPTRQPVVMDLWKEIPDDGALFTTVGNWRQPWRDVALGGEVYKWSKHLEFEKFLDLPSMTGQAFELALSGYTEADCASVEERGWKVLPALSFSRDPDAYRGYIRASRAEFTVAKDQNVRLRTGWFSDRSATYLAAGRPVVTQETGFSNILPTGAGLFAFTTVGEAVDAVASINGDYGRNRRSASVIAREFFSHEMVLPPLLELVGLRRPRHERGAVAPTRGLPSDLVLMPVSRWPTRLPERTLRFAEDIVSGRVRLPGHREMSSAPVASIVVVTYNGLPFTALCLRSLLAETEGPAYEVIVVDNGSDDGTIPFLKGLAGRDGRVRVLCNGENLGFAAANNLGLASATGSIMVLLNNDTIVPPGWLSGLVRHLDDPSIGLVGPVTNRSGNEAEIAVPYGTYGEFLAFAQDRAAAHSGELLEVATAIMFCVAFRRDVHGRIGPLDHRYRIAMFEDDDYSLRARGAGYRVVCAEDVFVHHFGQATIGNLASTSEYGELFHANRRRLEEKWGLTWEPHRLRPRSGYPALRSRVQEVVEQTVPSGASVLVVTKGDEDLLALGDRRAQHFPQGEDGRYAGYYPADSESAIAQLERLRDEGARYLLFPETAMWWLEHYIGLRHHLYDRYTVAGHTEGACLIFDISGRASDGIAPSVRVPVLLSRPAGSNLPPQGGMKSHGP